MAADGGWFVPCRQCTVAGWCRWLQRCVRAPPPSPPPSGARAILSAPDILRRARVAKVAKADADKPYIGGWIGGWASVVEIDGKPIVDGQGHTIAVDELREDAHDFTR
jgi:hypothetical protein